MAKKNEGKPSVRPCDPKRATGKFEGVYADGTVHPYAFRTEAEALAAVTTEAAASADDSDQHE